MTCDELYSASINRILSLGWEEEAESVHSPHKELTSPTNPLLDVASKNPRRDLSHNLPRWLRGKCGGCVRTMLGTTPRPCGRRDWAPPATVTVYRHTTLQLMRKRLYVFTCIPPAEIGPTRLPCLAPQSHLWSAVKQLDLPDRKNRWRNCIHNSRPAT